HTHGATALGSNRWASHAGTGCRSSGTGLGCAQGVEVEADTASAPSLGTKTAASPASASSSSDVWPRSSQSLTSGPCLSLTGPRPESSSHRVTRPARQNDVAAFRAYASPGRSWSGRTMISCTPANLICSAYSARHELAPLGVVVAGIPSDQS